MEVVAWYLLNMDKAVHDNSNDGRWKSRRSLEGDGQNNIGVFRDKLHDLVSSFALPQYFSDSLRGQSANMSRNHGFFNLASELHPTKCSKFVNDTSGHRFVAAGFLHSGSPHS